MRTSIDDMVARAHVNEAAFEGPRAVIPTRGLAIVTCMDSRIDTFRIFGLASGEAHVLRNAGGLVSDDVLRSLILSQRLLQTREVMLVHHSNCGLHGADEAGLRMQIERETGTAPAFGFGAFVDLDGAVRTALARVRDCAFLPHRESVRGFVYEVETGHLREIT